LAPLPKQDEWAEYGINSWNDLINLNFGDVNYKLGRYISKKGLDRAIERLQIIQKKIWHNPTYFVIVPFYRPMSCSVKI
jgi:hypothetical protein